jgi:hypothetical protein
MEEIYLTKQNYITVFYQFVMSFWPVNDMTELVYGTKTAKFGEESS